MNRRTFFTACAALPMGAAGVKAATAPEPFVVRITRPLVNNGAAMFSYSDGARWIVKTQNRVPDEYVSRMVGMSREESVHQVLRGPFWPGGKMLYGRYFPPQG